MMNQSDKASILYVFIYITCLGWTEDNKVLLMKKNRQLIYCLSHQGSPKEKIITKTMEIDALVPPPNATEDKVFIVPITSHILERLSVSCMSLHIISVKKIVNSCQCLKKKKKEKWMVTLDSKVPQRLKTWLWI